MRYRNITDSFLLTNVNTPERILDAFSSGAYGTNDSNSKIFQKCEEIAESNETKENKINMLTETIKNYHTYLYTK